MMGNKLLKELLVGTYLQLWSLLSPGRPGGKLLVSCRHVPMLTLPSQVPQIDLPTNATNARRVTKTRESSKDISMIKMAQRIICVFIRAARKRNLV